MWVLLRKLLQRQMDRNNEALRAVKSIPYLAVVIYISQLSICASLVMRGKNKNFHPVSLA